MFHTLDSAFATGDDSLHFGYREVIKYASVKLLCGVRVGEPFRLEQNRVCVGIIVGWRIG